MTVHGLRPEFQVENLKTATKTQKEETPEVIKPSTGEHEGIPSLHNTSALTGLGQSLDIKS